MATEITQGPGSKAIKSYKVVGAVEDMTDFVTSIDPDQTLLTNKFGKTSVTNTTHAWLCDSLRPAMENATLEVVDFDSQEATPRRRSENYTQQFLHGYTVSDTTQAIKKYGVRDELSYQMVKATKEIGRDLEYAICRNATKVLGDNGVVGKFGGIPYFLQDFKNVTIAGDTITLTNHGFVTGDAIVFVEDGTALGGTTKIEPNTQYYVGRKDANTFKVYATDTDAMNDKNPITPAGLTKAKVSFCNTIDAGKQAKGKEGDFNFDILNDAMQMAWSRGGSIDVAIMSGKNKRKASGFDSNLQVTKAMQSKELVDTVDVVETDFGRVQLIAHRMYPNDVVDLLELQYWKVGYLIPFHVEDGLRKGTYKSKYITGSATLECTAPNANARIYGLTK